MRRITTLTIGSLALLGLLSYLFTFQVEFHEAAVVTTFGRADESSVVDGRAESGLLGNLHLAWPWPVEEAHAYDMRLHTLEGALEEQETSDRQTVLISLHVHWRIDDPLAFFRSLVEERIAEEQLRALLRDARAVIGDFRFDELIAGEKEGETALGRVEIAILERMRSGLPTSPAWGLRIEGVGIERILLPEDVTRSVFGRMRASRERIAERARSEGAGLAAAIEARAESDRRAILAFADRRAREIEAEGHARAAKHFEAFREDEDFAIFLRTVETYASVLARNTTFVFDSKSGLFRLFEELVRPEGRP